MAKKTKQAAFKHCKVVETSHPSAPWRVSFPVEENGKSVRKRRMFSTKEKANDFAASHEKEVADFGVRFGAITGEARRAFDFYRDARADLSGEGIEVPTFEELVTAAVATLRREHQERQLARVTVAEAVEAFLAAKAGRVGARHAEDLKSQLGRFAAALGQRSLDAITANEIESWLESVRSPRANKQGNRVLIGPKTRNSIRVSLKTFFAYGCAPARAWCHRNPLADIEPEKVKQAEPKAYTPGDAAAILHTALAMNSPALPCLALGFFAGLRPSETMALDLSVINFEKDGFRVPAFHRNGEPTKTGARVAPLTAACKSWLAAQIRRKGFACPYEDRKALSVEMRAILAAAKVVGIFDGARHSFITYRTAELRDVARVADECGNSPNIIKKHYRELVTAEAALKFFAIRPEKKAGRKSKVVNIGTGRASA